MNDDTERGDMRAEYDFSGGVRGKHHAAASGRGRTVVLEPKVAKIFKDSKSVNQILKMIIKLAKGVRRRGA